MRRAIAIVALIATGCSAPINHEPATGPIDWKSLADGSRFYIRDTGVVIETSRCWQTSGGFDCVSVETFERESHEIWRTFRNTLEGPTQLNGSGYSCRTSFLDSALYSETISIDRRTKLATNFVFPKRGAPENWSAEFVEKLLSEAGITEGPYFRCAQLAEILREGSWASLGTSLVSHDDIVPPASPEAPPPSS